MTISTQITDNLRTLPLHIELSLQNSKISKSNEIRDCVYRILCVRIQKFAQASLLLRDQGFAEPGIVMLRSIYESHLWLCWILLSDENAQYYWDIGKREAALTAGNLVGKFGLKVRDVGDPNTFRKVYSDREAKSVTLPKFAQISKEVGLEKFHSMCYPFISCVAHGNPISLGEGLIKAGRGEKIPIGASQLNSEVFDMIAEMVSPQLILTINSWAKNRETKL
jgi:hypothetical protein